MFKEAEKGDKDINVLRTEQALEVHPNIIATACPFCNTMMTDGIKIKNKETQVKVYDIAELLDNSEKWVPSALWNPLRPTDNRYCCCIVWTPVR